VKRALVTGARGTVGRALTEALELWQFEVVAWDRAAAPPGDAEALARVFADVRPDLVYHLAVPSTPTGAADEGRLVSVTWSRQLAERCAADSIPFVFTSTVMVYSDQARGPFRPEGPAPDAAGGYGFEKLEGERAIRAACPDARIVRLGWQIGDRPGSNNMFDHLVREHDERGVLRPSARWRPATSFLADTAEALLAVRDLPGGVYLVDGNRCWTFAEIVAALAERHDLSWRIEPDDSEAAFAQDQRMQDDRLAVGSLDLRLAALREA